MRPPLRSKSVLFALALSVYAGGLASSPRPTTAKDKSEASAGPRDRASVSASAGATVATSVPQRVP